MNETRIKVITVVVSYNSFKSEFFPKCLDALYDLDTEGIDHEIVLVDSNSNDQTPDKVLQKYPQIKVMAQNENVGYAGGNNIGIKYALEVGADYVSVVTHDVEVDKLWLKESLQVFENQKNIGVVQPLLLLNQDRGLINSTGNQIHFLGYGYAGDYLKKLNDYEDVSIREIPYFSGAVILFSSKALKEVGLFDHDLWMYNEDQDLGWRLWMKGYKNILAPKALAYHHYEFSRSISKLYYMDRNRLIVLLQNYSLASLLIIMPALLANEIAGLLLSIAGGWFKEKLQVWKYFLSLSNWKKIFAKRRIRQADRTVSDREIIHRFTGIIAFQDVMNPVVKYIANPILALYWAICKIIIVW